MKNQTAVGFLAAILIGLILGAPLYYPITEPGRREAEAAREHLVCELESLQQEAEWFSEAAQASDFQDVVRLGQKQVRVISEAGAAKKPVGDLLLRSWAAYKCAETLAKIRSPDSPVWK